MLGACSVKLEIEINAAESAPPVALPFALGDESAFCFDFALSSLPLAAGLAAGFAAVFVAAFAGAFAAGFAVAFDDGLAADLAADLASSLEPALASDLAALLLVAEADAFTSPFVCA